MLCLRNSVVRNQTISYRKYHEIAEKARKMAKQLEKDTNIWYNVGVKLRKHTKPRCANMSNLINENYISIEDAALFLNIKPVTLRKWIKDKNVPAHKIGKQWKFKRSELEEWVKSGKSAME